MEKMNVKLMKLIKANLRVTAGYCDAQPYLYDRLADDVSVAPDMVATTAAVRRRRLERINETLIWSFPAEFGEASSFLYIPVYRKTMARLQYSIPGATPKYSWVEEIDPAPAKDSNAVVIIGHDVGDIVDPRADGDVVDIVYGDCRAELIIVPIGTIRKNAGPLAGFFAGYGMPRAPRRSDR